MSMNVVTELQMVHDRVGAVTEASRGAPGLGCHIQDIKISEHNTASSTAVLVHGVADPPQHLRRDALHIIFINVTSADGAQARRAACR